jgi:hypothetical protein
MTQNVWIGVNVGAVLSASETTEQASLVDDVLAEAIDSQFPDRAGAFARTVAEHEPDVIGLQEVTLWRTQQPADGPGTPAEDVALDYLALIEAALRAEELDYVAVAVHEGLSTTPADRTDGGDTAGLRATRDGVKSAGSC